MITLLILVCCSSGQGDWFCSEECKCYVDYMDAADADDVAAAEALAALAADADTPAGN